VYFNVKDTVLTLPLTLFRTGRIDFDVAPHLIQRIVSGALLHQGRIEVEAVDQLQCAIAAEDLLLDDVEPALELARRGIGCADDVLVDRGAR
jgi:hypothetical protein